jgi:hypothetical protein
LINIGQQRDVTYYYANYFSTWSDVIVLNSGSFYRIPGPFAPTTDATAHYTYSRTFLSVAATPTANKMTLSVDLNLLNGGSAITALKFNVFTMDSNQILKDKVEIVPQISNVAGAVQTGTDATDTGISAGLDIQEWRMSIE